LQDKWLNERLVKWLVKRQRKRLVKRQLKWLVNWLLKLQLRRPDKRQFKRQVELQDKWQLKWLVKWLVRYRRGDGPWAVDSTLKPHFPERIRDSRPYITIRGLMTRPAGMMKPEPRMTNQT
jgi:hypothetical protein